MEKDRRMDDQAFLARALRPFGLGVCAAVPVEGNGIVSARSASSSTPCSMSNLIFFTRLELSLPGGRPLVSGLGWAVSARNIDGVAGAGLPNASVDWELRLRSTAIETKKLHLKKS